MLDKMVVDHQNGQIYFLLKRRLFINVSADTAVIVAAASEQAEKGKYNRKYGAEGTRMKNHIYIISKYSRWAAGAKK